MKTFYNILLIFLIGFFSSSFLFMMSPIDYSNTIVIDEPIQKNTLNLTYEGENNLINPKNIVIEHKSDIEIELSGLAKNIFTANVYSGDELVLSNIVDLENSAISISDNKYVINSNNPLRTTLDISQDKLGLKDGKYKIVLSSNIISDESAKNIEIFISYETNFTYHEAQNKAPKETMGLTVYFTDSDANILIPVTRYVVKELSLNKQVIHELQTGPVNPSLKKTIDELNYCIYKDNTVIIDLPADNQFYNAGSTAGVMSYNSFIKSMFAINKYLAVDNVIFTVDKHTVEDYFHGISIKEPVTRSLNPIAYLGYKVDERMYLVEHEILDIDNNADIKTKALQLFEYYKAKLPSYARSPIPKDLAINNVIQDGDNLTLDFNDAFLTAFDNDQHKRKLMIDSLIYTFTSFEEINTINITVNGNPIENFIEGKDITGILKAPRFINPEKVE